MTPTGVEVVTEKIEKCQKWKENFVFAFLDQVHTGYTNKL